MAALSAAKEEFESGCCKKWVFTLATGISVMCIQACLFLVLTKNYALHMKRFFLMKVLSKPASFFEKR